MLQFLVSLVFGIAIGAFCTVWLVIRAISTRSSAMAARRAAGGDVSRAYLSARTQSTMGTTEEQGALILDAVRVEMQLAGKTRTRTRVFARLVGDTLLLSEKADSDPPLHRVGLQGCELRRAPPQVAMENCLEISHPHQKLLLTADYIYLSFVNSRMMHVWQEALTRWCVTRASDDTHHLPAYDRNADNVILHKGWLMVGYGESAAELRFCVLERFVMTHYDSSDLTKAKGGLVCVMMR